MAPCQVSLLPWERQPALERHVNLYLIVLSSVIVECNRLTTEGRFEPYGTAAWGARLSPRNAEKNSVKRGGNKGSISSNCLEFLSASKRHEWKCWTWYDGYGTLVGALKANLTVFPSSPRWQRQISARWAALFGFRVSLGLPFSSCTCQRAKDPGGDGASGAFGALPPGLIHLRRSWWHWGFVVCSVFSTSWRMTEPICSRSLDLSRSLFVCVAPLRPRWGWRRRCFMWVRSCRSTLSTVRQSWRVKCLNFSVPKPTWRKLSEWVPSSVAWSKHGVRSWWTRRFWSWTRWITGVGFFSSLPSLNSFFVIYVFLFLSGTL